MHVIELNPLCLMCVCVCVWNVHLFLWGGRGGVRKWATQLADMLERENVNLSDHGLFNAGPNIWFPGFTAGWQIKVKQH